MIDEMTVGVEHILVNEIAIGHGLAELAENVIRNGNGLDVCRYNLEFGSLQNYVRVCFMKSLGKWPGCLKKSRKIAFVPPKHQRPPDKLRLNVENQTHVVTRIHPAPVA